MMNERIRELARQAELAYAADVRAGFIYPTGTEKFAELIVQDCVNVLQDNGMWNSRVSDVLYEHFGVEE